MSRIKQFCINQHDTFIMGRAKNGVCSPCNKIMHKKEYKKHRKIILETQKIYNQKHKKERNEYRKLYNIRRMKVDLTFKLTTRLRTRLSRLVKNFQKGQLFNKTISAVKDLGCTIPELKRYLEKQFKPNMFWNNYGKWHVDHISALSNFDLTDREQFLKAVNYKNLQPLWEIDNKSKGNR